MGVSLQSLAGKLKTKWFSVRILQKEFKYLMDDGVK